MEIPPFIRVATPKSIVVVVRFHPVVLDLLAIEFRLDVVKDYSQMGSLLFRSLLVNGEKCPRPQ